MVKTRFTERHKVRKKEKIAEARVGATRQRAAERLIKFKGSRIGEEGSKVRQRQPPQQRERCAGLVKGGQTARLLTHTSETTTLWMFVVACLVTTKPETNSTAHGFPEAGRDLRRKPGV